MATTFELRTATGNPIHGDDAIVNFRNLESETEDEEVKMNCIGGFRGGDDSEIFSSTSSDDDDDDDDDDDEQPNKERYDHLRVQIL
jgi:hypothetical protein